MVAIYNDTDSSSSELVGGRTCRINRALMSDRQCVDDVMTSLT